MHTPAMTRRSFLKAGAALTGTLALGDWNLLAQPGRRSERPTLVVWWLNGGQCARPSIAKVAHRNLGWIAPNHPSSPPRPNRQGARDGAAPLQLAEASRSSRAHFLEVFDSGRRH